MRILVTGAAGFVGSRLCRALFERGHHVTGTFINSGPKVAGVELHEIDLLDLPNLCRVVKLCKPEVVVHLAGLSHVGESWKSPDKYFQVNVLGTENILEAAGRGRFIFASSAEVYGIVPEDQQPICEDRPLAPRSPYALTKAAAERMALAHGAVVVRSCNVLGPGQAQLFALPTFAQQLRDQMERRPEALIEVGNLSARRDFLHLNDAIDGYIAVIERGEPGDCYNLGSGTALAISEMLDRLIRISGVEANIQVDPGRLREVDIPLLRANCDKLRSLGWLPTRTVDSALRELWQSLTSK